MAKGVNLGVGKNKETVDFSICFAVSRKVLGCAEGIEALREYKYEFSESLGGVRTTKKKYPLEAKRAIYF